MRSYTYDDLDRVVTMTYQKGSETIGSFAYTYDQNSNILSKTEQDNSVAGKETDITKDYTYDTLGQLVKSITEDHKKNETDTILYLYDKAGNRTNMLDGDEMTSYTYNGLDHPTKSVTTKNGKTTSNQTYVYDANGNEISVTDSVEGTTVTSTYDPADQLATRSQTKDGVTVFTQENNSRLASLGAGFGSVFTDIIPIRIPAHPRGAYIRWEIELPPKETSTGVFLRIHGS